MTKEVTVLGLEGSMLRGIRLSESGKEYQIVASETWETGAPETAAGGAAPDGAETAADALLPKELPNR